MPYWEYPLCSQFASLAMGPVVPTTYLSSFCIHVLGTGSVRVGQRYVFLLRSAEPVGTFDGTVCHTQREGLAANLKFIFTCTHT